MRFRSEIVQVDCETHISGFFYYADKGSIVRSHFSTSSGLAVIGSLVRRRPKSAVFILLKPAVERQGRNAVVPGFRKTAAEPIPRSHPRCLEVSGMLVGESS